MLCAFTLLRNLDIYTVLTNRYHLDALSPCSEIDVERKTFGKKMIELINLFLRTYWLIYWLNELSHKLISKITIQHSPWSRGRKTPFGRKERTTYSPYKEKTAMVQKNTRKKRHLQINKREKKKKHVWLPGRLHVEEQLNEGPRLQWKHKNEKWSKAKQRWCQRKTSWHLQTKRLEDTSSRHLWLVNKGERTSTSPLALGYPLIGPSRQVRAYHCML